MPATSFFKRRIVPVLLYLIVFGVTAWTLWSWFAPTAHVRYRLDVTLEVDGAPVTGSVVQEMTISSTPIDLLPDAGQVSRNVRGQALALDLPGRGTLFVAMTRYCTGTTEWGQCKGDYGYLVDQACGIKREQPNFAVYVRRFKRLDGSCPLTADQLPVIVRFDDENDQSSVHVVRPEHLAAAFGAGVRFINASVTFTGAPLTTGLRTRLPWLAKDPPPSYSVMIEDADGSQRPFVPQFYFERI
ncbi:hypothetical protein GCM10011316_10490 [Roseibium aquae]|uniref:Uncharacterized protein n=1 Tax=Roseibium aquae TaxID=1323746 RepID=A0A916WWW9_9HYPH|nr:hypothetical protein [Roseibium aquae]GGB40326.1 hypothetical protein GCM10011316_10490 [Roseibium aquae]